MLYDIDSNPEEDIDVQSENANVYQAMLEQLELWDSTLPTQYCLGKSGCTVEFLFDPSKAPRLIGPPKLLMGPTFLPTSGPTLRPLSGEFTMAMLPLNLIYFPNPIHRNIH